MDAANKPATQAESRALTGLRGIGAILVITHHLYLYLQPAPHPALDGLLRRGYMGVDLFFVLSGFVVSLAYGTWFDGGTRIRLRSLSTFLIRRVARLWPLHATTLLVILMIGGWDPHPDFLSRQLVPNLAMIQAWDLGTSLNPPTWSVSAEFLAYLLFPVIAGPLLRGRFGPVIGGASVVILLAAALYGAPPLGPARRGWLDIYQNYSLTPVLRCLAGFTLGMLAWRAGRTPALQRLFPTAWIGPTALLAFPVMLLAGVNDLMIYPLLPLIVLGMHVGTGPAVRALAWGPVHRLGVLSYAVYLIHYPLLRHIPLGRAPLWFVLPAYFASTLGLAALAHNVIEVPARILIRRLVREPIR